MDLEHPIDVDRWPALEIPDFAPGKVFRATHVHDAEKARALADSLGLPEASAAKAMLATFRPVYDALGGRFPQGSVHVGYDTTHLGEVPDGTPLEVAVVSAPPDPPRDGYQKVRFDVTYHDGDTLVAEQTITVLCTVAAKTSAP